MAPKSTFFLELLLLRSPTFFSVISHENTFVLDLLNLKHNLYK